MGWNQPSNLGQGSHAKSHRRKGPKNIPVIRSLVMLVLAVAICATVVWLILDSGRDTQPANRDGIPEKSNVARGTKKVQKQNPATTTTKKTPTQINAPKDQLLTAEGGRTNDNQEQVPLTNAAIRAQLEKFRKEPVKGLAEQLIMMVIPPKKGEFVPPPPLGIETTPELESAAQAMLERQGVVETWDDDNSIGIKERLELLKDEWYAFKKEGGTFHEFLQKRLRESNFNTETLEEARKFDNENYQDQTLSDEEYEQLHGKVNKLLEMQGFDKIERPDAELKIEEEKE